MADTGKRTEYDRCTGRDQRVVIGVIVVAAVLLDVVVSGQFGRHKKK